MGCYYGVKSPDFIVVWFKRDIRLTDHAAISWAIKQGVPVLFLYIHEPSVFKSVHYSVRHERFVWEGVKDVQDYLEGIGGRFYAVESEVIDVFNYLCTLNQLYWVVSLEEIGVEITYARDRMLNDWFADKELLWAEIPYSGIRRGLKNRKDFNTYWYGYMAQIIENQAFDKLSWWLNEDWDNWAQQRLFKEVNREVGIVQSGGYKNAQRYLNSFFQRRIARYMQSISKPELARVGCSRLSAYLAWGHISLREVYQWQAIESKNSPWKRNFTQFASRLRWREHFIQKFESQCSMEFLPINSGYRNWQFNNNELHITAWKEGRTGVPLVDACMRSLVTTGYLNFRMRAMLVSFFTHYLNESWEVAAEHLSKQFLDFEPGIHFPQIQMQAGFTGTNTLRIYNPTKQAEDHDPEGFFIKHWIPALAHVPVPKLFEPWTLTQAEQIWYNVQLGLDYPLPIIDLKTSYTEAKDRLWGWRKKKEVQEDSGRVLERLSLPKRKRKEI